MDKEDKTAPLTAPESAGLEPGHAPRRRPRIFLWLLLAAALLAGLVWSPLLALQEIRVSGQTSIPAEDFYQILGVHRGDPLLLIRPSNAEQALLKDLRIEHGTVEYAWPTGLHVDITEREALAVVACDYGYLNIDREGRVIFACKYYQQQKIPLLVGLRFRDAYIGDQLEDAGLTGILDYLSRLDAASRAAIERISVDANGYAVAYVPGAVEIRIGQLERLDEKARLTRDFLAELKTAKYPIAYIDLNYSSPFIKFK